MASGASPDPFARYPETSEFIVMLPAIIQDDDERRDGLLDHLEAAFPGSTFRAVECTNLRDPEGGLVIISEPMVVPIAGTAGTGSEPGRVLRRPSMARMQDIRATLHAFLNGTAALN